MAEKIFKAGRGLPIYGLILHINFLSATGLGLGVRRQIVR